MAANTETKAYEKDILKSPRVEKEILRSLRTEKEVLKSPRAEKEILNAAREGEIRFFEMMHEKIGNARRHGTNCAFDKRDFKTTDKNGNNLLHIASMCGHLQLIKEAIHGLGVDINSKNNDGLDALKLAMARNNHEAFNLLLKEGISAFLYDKNGNTNIHIAAGLGTLPNSNKSYLELLFRTSKNYTKIIDAQNKNGDTALHAVFRSKKLSLTQTIQNAMTLLENGAKILPNNLGETPLDICSDPWFRAFMKTYTKEPARVKQ